MVEDKQSPHFRHLEFPKTKARDDFWGQISRTVNGEPVSEEDIDQIVKAIRQGLDLNSSDVVLDVGCGNGALSRYFFEEVAEFHGVDFSSYLIGVAKEYFEDLPRFSFQESDAVSYVSNERLPEKFTKVLCYGVFSYLSPEEANAFLGKLSERFSSVERILIGNLPDRDKASDFYREDIDFKPLLDDHLAAIGIWRSQDDFRELAAQSGWDVEFKVMPEDFYSSHYRYDAVLSRK